ncbi:uncharacterized protein Dwil_GK11197 [Drosophila willistoni]|uniref:Fatty acyl-CoA reductase n=1 Tax=Drosophila willistoni TaxID=7260 RepID=B4NBE5_DROWI|nr:fatty acyl-CoA reductase wat [Drosophila willistoni]EDW81109.2 uncharacterized protein Dwil_GK11197 [Drosophila willistoni]
MDTETESEIQKFYKHKIVFVTGGSGFLGKVIIEKLLRSTEAKRIYVMIRPKQGQDINERFAAWENDPVFTTLLDAQPKSLERVMPIAGDCQASDLGINEEDRRLLVEEVQVVLHSAATVRFMEPLHVALAINTRAAGLMLQLAKEMTRLEVFVHISTAFSNCVVNHIEERYYPEHLNCTVDQVLQLTDNLSEEMVDGITTTLLDKFPNTYTYTKALAEQLIQREAGDMPICVYRPGVIIASYKEPMSGWIDNLNGPIALLYGAAFGIVRVSWANYQAQAGIVPVDYCANMALVCAWKTAQETTRPADPPIYNHVPSDQNLITWGGFRDKAKDHVRDYPLTQMMWCPFLHFTSSGLLFRLAAFFYHIIPGFLIDMALRLRGQKSRMLKLYDKVHKNIVILSPFTIKSWGFESDNAVKLWQSLTPRDKVLFEFNMRDLDWDNYFLNALRGMRIYMGKEDPGEESIKRGQAVLNRFLTLHRILQCILSSAFAFIMWSLLKYLVNF